MTRGNATRLVKHGKDDVDHVVNVPMHRRVWNGVRLTRTRNSPQFLRFAKPIRVARVDAHGTCRYGPQHEERSARSARRETNASLRARTRARAALWMGVVLCGAMVALALNAAGHRISIDRAAAAPRASTLRFGIAVVPIVVVVLLATLYATHVAVTLRWHRLLVVAAGGSLAWSIALASVRGVDRITLPTRSSTRVPCAPCPWSTTSARSSAGSSRTFATYPVHVQGHPPGTVAAPLRAPRRRPRRRVVGRGTVRGRRRAPRSPRCSSRPEMSPASSSRVELPRSSLSRPPRSGWQRAPTRLYTGLSAWGAALVIVATGRRDRRGDSPRRQAACCWRSRHSVRTGSCSSRSSRSLVAVARRRIRPVARRACRQARSCSPPSRPGASGGSPVSRPHVRATTAGIASIAPVSRASWSIDLAAFALALGSGDRGRLRKAARPYAVDPRRRRPDCGRARRPEWHVEG